nr:PhnD/SsuA/transferrin family substrate-binding protein [uncultured Desulfobacter sp.]
MWADDATDAGLQEEAIPAEEVRFGFVQAILGTINENDAKAAIRSWTNTLVEELGLPAIPFVSIYEDLAQIQTEIEKKQVDVVCLTTPQWFAVRDLISEDGLLAVKAGGTINEEYVVLVHRTSSANSLQDLKGKSLRVWEYSRTALSCTWLRSLMVEKGLGPADEYFSKIKWVKKINEAVLPVFFKQADACLVNLKGLDIMAELNPQIAQQVKIVEKSSPYIPVIFCFRKDYHAPIKQILLDDLQEMMDSSAGGQLLTIFQMEGMEKVSIVDFANIVTLLEKDYGICDRSKSRRIKGAKN